MNTDATEIPSSYNLVLSVEVARHGERQPGHLFPLAANPDEEFKVAYNLTETGAQSHYANG